MAVIEPNTAGKFDTGVITIDDSSNYVEAMRMNIHGRGGRVSIQGDVGAGGALAHLKICANAVTAGKDEKVKEDTDFNTLDSVLVGSTANPHTTSGSGQFYIQLEDMQPVEELTIFAKKSSATTTLRLRGNVFP